MISYSSYEWFPNSEICGSKLICSSPQLIAAYHVLHRLLMPRHSPYALVRLNFLHRSFDLCCSFLLNCLSFFVHIFSVCSKKALAFSPLFFRLVCRGSLRVPLVEIVFYPTFLERPIFLNIMSSISVRFYSFTFIRFSMNMVSPESR